jgi:uncharacterized protein (DUF1697 family)
MPRYVAFLRGVSPMNAKMPELRRCFEAAGYTDVKTLLSSGNVVFGARAGSTARLEGRVEAAIRSGLDRGFDAFVRSTAQLQALIEADPFAGFEFAPAAKRVVSFLRHPVERGFVLPPERDGARILKVSGAEVYSVYVPGPKGPVFMNLLERSFGTAMTTRTLDTVRKCALA